MRKKKLYNWLESAFAVSDVMLVPLRNDASFRQYYRCMIDGNSYVVMDAPPDKENTVLFKQVSLFLHNIGVPVPLIIADDSVQGFMVLSDLGDRLLLDDIIQYGEDEKRIIASYQRAMDHLLVIQAHDPLTAPFAIFDEAHSNLELSYFMDWFVGNMLALNLTSEQEQMLHNTLSLITHTALNQPQVIIHRDFHSRNLMVLVDGDLGVIDYQDAMIGPITYDLVSLLKDCYIVWPKAKIDLWVDYFYEKSVKTQLGFNSKAAFQKSFDWMGLQRHLKVLGVFSRLKIRDNKPNYIKDMPRIIDYILSVTSQYEELFEFNNFFEQIIMPGFLNINHVVLEDSCVQ